MTDDAKETDADLLARLGTDGMKWANEWVKVVVANDLDPVDVGFMVTWFANAIEAGRDAGIRAAVVPVIGSDGMDRADDLAYWQALPMIAAVEKSRHQARYSLEEVAAEFGVDLHKEDDFPCREIDFVTADPAGFDEASAEPIGVEPDEQLAELWTAMERAEPIVRDALLQAWHDRDAVRSQVAEEIAAAIEGLRAFDNGQRTLRDEAVYRARRLAVPEHRNENPALPEGSGPGVDTAQCNPVEETP